MTRAARSVGGFGIYLVVMGSTIVLVPNTFLSLFALPATDEVWFRLLGVILIYVGTYYLVAARHALVPIFRASIPVRLSLLGFLAAFVGLGYVKSNVLVFGLADVAGALWTHIALKQDGGGTN